MFKSGDRSGNDLFYKRYAAMHPHLQLRQLLDESYEVFSRYSQPQALLTSPLRDPVKLLTMLTSKPLRQLNDDDVHEYAAAALTTVGTVEDYKHFLPRLLDLALETGVVEPELIAIKLRTAGWLTWPQNETQLIREILLEACKYGFRQHPNNYLVQSWLVSLAILDVDLGNLRRQAGTSDCVFCGLQLAHLILTDLLFENEPGEGGYWTEVSERTAAAMQSWLLGDDVRMRLSAARVRVEPEDLWLLDKALTEQERLVHQRLR